MEKGLVLWGSKSIFYVEDANGKEYKCLIKGKILDNEFDIPGKVETTPLVAGDQVLFEKIAPDEGRITKRLPRRNEFIRLKQGGRTVQTLVANIDTLVIVDSVVSPPLRTFFIDRILFTADIMNIQPLIVINKIDLLDRSMKSEYTKVMKQYEAIGYDYLSVSAQENKNLNELKKHLQGKVCSFNGRSGVGKSSLIKSLDPHFDFIKTGEISNKFNRGTHTTTIARLYELNFGAKIIDTPGVREFSVYLDKPEDVELNFRDFETIRHGCHYTNCQHVDEPECAVKEAVEKGKFSSSRYESYLRIRETIQTLSDSRI